MACAVKLVSNVNLDPGLMTVKLRMEMVSCQKDNNPTEEQKIAQGQQSVLNTARKSRTRKRFQWDLLMLSLQQNVLLYKLC